MVMNEYLRYLLHPILLHPDKLVITTTEDADGTLLSVQVAPKDTGRVIGKAGETIKAIRTIIHAAGSSESKRVSVRVLEPNR